MGKTPGKMTVAELKDELTARGLDTKGLKAELVARLEAATATGAEDTYKPQNDGEEAPAEPGVEAGDAEPASNPDYIAFESSPVASAATSQLDTDAAQAAAEMPEGDLPSTAPMETDANLGTPEDFSAPESVKAETEFPETMEAAATGILLEAKPGAEEIVKGVADDEKEELPEVELDAEKLDMHGLEHCETDQLEGMETDLKSTAAQEALGAVKDEVNGSGGGLPQPAGVPKIDKPAALPPPPQVSPVTRPSASQATKTLAELGLEEWLLMDLPEEWRPLPMIQLNNLPAKATEDDVRDLIVGAGFAVKSVAIEPSGPRTAFLRLAPPNTSKKAEDGTNVPTEPVEAANDSSEAALENGAENPDSTMADTVAAATATEDDADGKKKTSPATPNSSDKELTKEEFFNDPDKVASEAAAKITKLGLELGGSRITASLCSRNAELVTLYVGNLPDEIADDATLRSELAKFGAFDRCFIVTSPDGSSKGYGIVEMSLPSSALKVVNELEEIAKEMRKGIPYPEAVAMQKGALAKPPLVVSDTETVTPEERPSADDNSETGKDAKPKTEGASGKKDFVKPTRAEWNRSIAPATFFSKNLYIANLNPGFQNEAVLKQEFSVFGPVRECHIAKNKATGFAKGFAFMEFVHTASATAAYKALDNKSTTMGKLAIAFSNPCKTAQRKKATPNPPTPPPRVPSGPGQGISSAGRGSSNISSSRLGTTPMGMGGPRPMGRGMLGGRMGGMPGRGMMGQMGILQQQQAVMLQRQQAAMMIQQQRQMVVAQQAQILQARRAQEALLAQRRQQQQQQQQQQEAALRQQQEQARRLEAERIRREALAQAQIRPPPPSRNPTVNAAAQQQARAVVPTNRAYGSQQAVNNRPAAPAPPPNHALSNRATTGRTAEAQHGTTGMHPGLQNQQAARVYGSQYPGQQPSAAPRAAQALPASQQPKQQQQQSQYTYSSQHQYPAKTTQQAPAAATHASSAYQQPASATQAPQQIPMVAAPTASPAAAVVYGQQPQAVASAQASQQYQYQQQQHAYQSSQQAVAAPAAAQPAANPYGPQQAQQQAYQYGQQQAQQQAYPYAQAQQQAYPYAQQPQQSAQQAYQQQYQQQQPAQTQPTSQYGQAQAQQQAYDYSQQPQQQQQQGYQYGQQPQTQQYGQQQTYQYGQQQTASYPYQQQPASTPQAQTAQQYAYGQQATQQAAAAAQQPTYQQQQQAYQQQQQAYQQQQQAYQQQQGYQQTAQPAAYGAQGDYNANLQQPGYAQQPASAATATAAAATAVQAQPATAHQQQAGQQDPYAQYYAQHYAQQAAQQAAAQQPQVGQKREADNSSYYQNYGAYYSQQQPPQQAYAAQPQVPDPKRAKY